MILVVGATGLLGGQIVKQAILNGNRVRGLVRPSASKERLDELASLGLEFSWGDLKDSHSLNEAVQGVDIVISTASSTLHRQQGDTIDSVDHRGQVSLVEAAAAARVKHFTFFGLNELYGDSPILKAKLAVEKAIRSSGMAWTNLIGNFFMEVWLSPALGFDPSSAKATCFGEGDGRNWWVSYHNMAEAAAKAHLIIEARNRSFEACGPQGVTQREVVDLFESKSREKFQIEYVSADQLHRQFRNAEDSLEETFASLKLACAKGISMDPCLWKNVFDLKLKSLHDYSETITQNLGK